MYLVERDDFLESVMVPPLKVDVVERDDVPESFIIPPLEVDVVERDDVPQSFIIPPLEVDVVERDDVPESFIIPPLEVDVVERDDVPESFIIPPLEVDVVERDDVPESFIIPPLEVDVVERDDVPESFIIPPLEVDVVERDDVPESFIIPPLEVDEVERDDVPESFIIPPLEVDVVERDDVPDTVIFPFGQSPIMKIPSIATTLGPHLTRTEMIPLVLDIIADDEDDQLAFAGQLGNFTRFVGGAEYAMYLIPPLEKLARNEKSVIRDKAVESLRIVVAEHSAKNFAIHVLPTLKRMLLGKCPTLRSSACGLVSDCYPRVSQPIKDKLRVKFGKLCQDKSPIVRRAAATNFGEFAKVVEIEYLKSDLIPNYVQLAQDDQVSVRLLAVEAGVSIAELLAQEDLEQLFLPTFRQCFRDSSWRVRYMVADQFVDLQKAVGPEITLADLVPALPHLLHDDEAEVRAVIATKVMDFCVNFKKANRLQIIVNGILPFVCELVNDPDQHVKMALAPVIMRLNPLLDSYHNLGYLLPSICRLLSDECPDVRLNIIANLDYVDYVEIFSQELIQAIVALATNSKLQVRLAIIDCMPALAARLGQEFFDVNLRQICIGWLNDNVYAVREAAAMNIKKIVKHFGAQWARRATIPMILAITQNRNYLRRMICLFCINGLAEVCGTEITTKLLLPTVLLLTGDPVANVRFNVAKTLQGIAPFLKTAVIDSQVSPALEKLLDDTDVDVRYFAAEAITHIAERMDGMPVIPEEA